MASISYKDTLPVVVEGLERLEYRGYDSAGVSFLDKNGNIQTIKKEGKIQNLKKELEANPEQAFLSIGHTRWATHGVVNDTNAHPHANQDIAVVHNGIIENAGELLEEFLEGVSKVSETDSEVFLLLLTRFFKESNNIQAAIYKAFGLIRGNSSFVILDKTTKCLYAIKSSAPLVVGKDDLSLEAFATSDPYALVGKADKIYFPEDGILFKAEMNNGHVDINFYDEDGNSSDKFKVQEQQIRLDETTKGSFDHFMHKEIHEQPKLIQSYSRMLKDHGVKFDFTQIDLKNINGISIIACGTALHAGMLLKNYIEEQHSIKVSTDFASEFRYKKFRMGKNELAVFISQSGETADTLACQELCKKNGVKTLGIVNVEGSTLYRECDANLLIYAGREIGVASTKAFTQQVLVSYILSCFLQNGKAPMEEYSRLDLLATRINELIAQEEEIATIAKELVSYNGFIFTGRNNYYPIALEGALKLKEIAYVHAEGYASGELKHGPISLFDENMVNVCIVDPYLREKTLSNAQEVKSRKGRIFGIGSKDDKELQQISDHFFSVDFEGLDSLAPLLVNVVLQIFSYYFAKEKGTDIDKPRNLAKSVTVE